MQNDLAKAVIGITMGLSMEDHHPEIYPAFSFEFCKQQYYEALEEAGAVVLPLPNTSHIEHTDYYSKIIDGLLLVGGEDVYPGLYAPEISDRTGQYFPRRDYFEREMIFKAVSLGIPILGICRGQQLLNVVFGGTLYQDLSEREEPTLDHRQTATLDFANRHEIELEPSSRLASLLASQRVTVNSAHHQIVRHIPQGLKPVALAPDGVVEALEGTDHNYILTVQWHPEAMQESPISRAIFRDFIAFAEKYKCQKVPPG